MKNTLTEKMRIAANERAARRFLLDALEYDCTGQLKDAGLSFEQEVQYKIALSLKNISDRLERMADAGRL